MGNVIGPINREDWVNLINSRGCLRFWKNTDSSKYQTAIEKTEIFYKTKIQELSQLVA